jgi:glucose-6-phosphate isomerase
MGQIKFDFNNMFSSSIGKEHGVTEADLSKMSGIISKAHNHFRSILKSKRNRINLELEWRSLPWQDRKTISAIQNLGGQIAQKFENVILLGIGGSYLGLKAAQDALSPPYYNEFLSLRNRKPRIYFEGNNLDPETLYALLDNLNPKKTFVIVISKSGETIETKAAFAVVESWLKKGVGRYYGRSILAITDSDSGTLRQRVEEEQSKDRLSFRSLPLLKGVGGRYSEFNMGLLHLAIIGVKLEEVLSGAQAMAERCSGSRIFKNPAYMYAVLQTILYKKRNKSIAILMPFAESLKSTADWYCQLLAESTGKKYGRSIKINFDGIEEWGMDKKRIVNTGRTPVACRGTNDLHSIQQNNIEGQNNKTITFIRVENFSHDIKVSGSGDFLSGKYYSSLLSLAQEATEWSLVRESRPNCTIIMPKINPYHWAELIFFFEMATAFEGELLNINAFDQPGVEGYKNYMYYKLRKPGLSGRVAREIRRSPLVKKTRFIIQSL